MNLPSKLNLTGKDSKTEQIFEELIEGKTFFDVEYETPSGYVLLYWSPVDKKFPEGTQNNNIRGKLFELIFATLLVRENLLPFYSQAKVAFVPNVEYDFVFYSQERGPINISLKTSLRERYKQADLEAYALKNVHRRALAYLLTMNQSEAATTKAKIPKGDIIGLDDIIFAGSTDLDDLIHHLKSFTLIEPQPIRIISGGKLVSSEMVDMVKN